MIHPYVVQWLAEGCTIQALPTPRGKRNALLLNRGLVTAVLRLHEDDYQELVAGGPLSKNEVKGDRGEPGRAARGARRGPDATAAGGQDVGVVSSSDAGVAGPAGEQDAVDGRSGSRGGAGRQR
jgi:hypothetical protein